VNIGNTGITGTVLLNMPVTVNSVTLGIGGFGTLDVSGNNILTTNTMTVGDQGPGGGTLNISGGGIGSDGTGYIGALSGSVGTVAVSGAGSQWNTSGTLYVGDYGQGSLSITSGGSVISGGAYIGYQSGSSGNVTVSGAGSQWNNSGNLFIGSSGVGSLAISGGGAVNNGSGGFISGVALSNSAQIQAMNGSTVTVGGDVSNSGTLSFDNSTLHVNGNVSGSGSLVGSNNSALTITGNLTANSGIDLSGSSLTVGGDLTEGNALFVRSGSAVNVAGNLSNFGFLFDFNTGANTLAVSQTLTNQAGASIVLGPSTGVVIAGSFVNDGFAFIVGTLNVSGAIVNNAPPGTGLYLDGPSTGGMLVNNGFLFISSTLDLTNQPGGVTDIPAGSGLILDGLLTAGGVNGLANVTNIDGQLSFVNGQTTFITPNGGVVSIGSSGVLGVGPLYVSLGSQVYITGSVSNAGNLNTSQSVGAGTTGSTLSISGKLTNASSAQFSLNLPGDVANVGFLINDGSIYVAPGATLNLTNQASGITDVVAGSTFDLAGTFNAGANSGFYQLTSVEGTLILENGQTTTSTPMGGILTVSNTGAIHIDNNSVFQVNGSIDNFGYIGQDPSTLIVTGTLTNEVGSTFNLMAGDVLQAGNIVNKGAFGVPGGATIQTAHYLSSAQTTLSPLATLLVGTGPAGNTGYYQLANGTLGEFIDASRFGVIVVNGPVHLDGTLDIQLFSGFNPAVGSTYDFITFAPGSYDGSVFASILNGVFNKGTEKWVVIYNSFGGSIELMAQANNQPTPEPATLLLLGGGALGVGYRMRRKGRG
jgi:T5SS/PEP-CTERM-associated repeat protein